MTGLTGWLWCIVQHALVSIALLQTGRCDEDGIVASLPVSGRHIAWANLICSMISICFGLVSKTMQQLILSSDPRASSLARSLLDSAGVDTQERERPSDIGEGIQIGGSE
jgi:hypothetical protein